MAFVCCSFDSSLAQICRKLQQRPFVGDTSPSKVLLTSSSRTILAHSHFSMNHACTKFAVLIPDSFSLPITLVASWVPSGGSCLAVCTMWDIVLHGRPRGGEGWSGEWRPDCCHWREHSGTQDFQGVSIKNTKHYFLYKTPLFWLTKYRCSELI